MRILLVTKPHLPVMGGGQMTVHWLALALADRGHPVSVLSVARASATPGGHVAGARQDRTLGYPVIRLPEPSAVTPALLDDLAPDVAVLNGFHDSLVEWGTQLLRTLRGVPTALYLHDARGVQLAAQVDCVAAVSRFLAEQCKPGTLAIPPIIDRSRYRVPTTRQRALFVNPVPAKGLATAIELASARPDIPFAFQRCWPLAPPILASLRTEVRRLANVELRGPSLDPRAIYGDARVLLAPSTGVEAWGRVAREAQASGIPVVGAGVGGLPEAVGSGGVVLGSGEGLEGWLDAVGKLWDDPEAYAAAVENAELQGADPDAGSDVVGAAFERLLMPIVGGEKYRKQSRRALAPAEAESRPPAFLVGLRYPHHARHSGYDRFAEHLGHRIRAPIRARWFPGRAGTAVNRALAAALGRPRYSVSVLLAEVVAAAHMLRRKNSVYHVMYGDRDLLLLRFLAGRRGNRLIATFHGPLAVPAPTLEWLPRTLDAVILVAEYQRSYFESLLPPDRIFVVRHGVDSEFFHPGAETAADRTCITVGSHLRDFATLTRTVEHVWRQDPAVRFVFAGLESDGVLGPLARDKRVRVLARVSDAELRAAYQTAGVALFAFQDATASNSLLEAMACGLPVVTTDVGGVGEYVNSDAACLCAPGDAECMAYGVLALLADPKRARRMGRASRALAVELDYRSMAAEVRKVYAHVLDEHAPNEIRVCR